MTPGYSGKPLATKLGIKAASEIYVAGAPDEYLKLIAPLPDGVAVSSKLSKKTNLVHLFTTRKSELARALQSYRTKLDANAAVWISWPKKSSKVPTDITEDTVRELALPLGFVDIKVCAVTEVWSGLKLVIRKELR
jgi:hypothetical protein